MCRQTGLHRHRPFFPKLRFRTESQIDCYLMPSFDLILQREHHRRLREFETVSYPPLVRNRLDDGWHGSERKMEGMGRSPESREGGADGTRKQEGAGEQMEEWVEVGGNGEKVGR